jgi:hypothetical protein
MNQSKIKSKFAQTTTKFNLELYLRVLQAKDMPFNRFSIIKTK